MFTNSNYYSSYALSQAVTCVVRTGVSVAKGKFTCQQTNSPKQTKVYVNFQVIAD